MKNFTIYFQTFILISLFFTFNLTYSQVGVGTTSPAYEFHVLNNGNVGATSLSTSENTGPDGVAFTGINTSTRNGYNGIMVNILVFLDLDLVMTMVVHTTLLVFMVMQMIIKELECLGYDQAVVDQITVLRVYFLVP